MDLDAIPLIPARWMRDRARGATVRFVVLHSMEGGERGDSAESCALWFQKVPYKASTHYCADTDSVVQCVPLDRACYGAGGVNDTGIHIEQAGTAAQTRDQWLDKYSRSMLDGQVAPLAAALCNRYSLPAVFRTAPELAKGLPGITTHAECVKAFGGDHWDPGHNYPIDHVVAHVATILADGADDMPLTEVDLARIEQLIQRELSNKDARDKAFIQSEFANQDARMVAWFTARLAELDK